MACHSGASEAWTTVRAPEPSAPEAHRRRSPASGAPVPGAEFWSQWDSPRCAKVSPGCSGCGGATSAGGERFFFDFFPMA